MKRIAFGVAAALAATTVLSGWRLGVVGATATPKDSLATMDVSPGTVGTLAPGGRATVVLRITNSGSQDVVVHEIVGNGAITSDVKGCNASAVTFTGRTDLSVVVPRKTGQAAGTVDVTLAAAAAMSNAANDACQRATFTIPVRLAGDPKP